MDSGAADRKGLTGVGYAGKGTVNRTRGIVSDNFGAVPERDDCLK